MAQRTVRLVAGARAKALAQHAPVGFLTDPDQDVRGGKNEVVVTSREYHILQAHGLIEEGSAQLIVPAADQPEAEQAQGAGKYQAMQEFLDQRRGAGLPLGDMPKDFKREFGLNPGGTVTKQRGPSGTDRGVHSGGVGHQPDDGYSNIDRVQHEIRMDQFRGAVERAMLGLGSVKDEELDRVQVQQSETVTPSPPVKSRAKKGRE